MYCKIQNVISDDYGFESNASDSIYDKLMKKYEANPEVIFLFMNVADDWKLY